MVLAVDIEGLFYCKHDLKMLGRCRATKIKEKPSSCVTVDWNKLNSGSCLGVW